MPQNYKLASEQWDRFTYCRDQAHLDFLHKARKCKDYVIGKQWDPAVKAELDAVRRPALTINKTLITLSSILGEQIDLRTETAFKGRYGAPSTNADVLTKVFRYISDRNQLNWVRSELFSDGAITSRGFLDVRMNFDNSLTGDVIITNKNSSNILPDPDGHEYDPDKWNDVIETCWYRVDDIALLYNEADAKALSQRAESVWSMGFDSIDSIRDRFGGTLPTTGNLLETNKQASRYIRVIDRQYRKLSKIKYFVNIRTGDKKEIPSTWDRNKIALFVQQAQGTIVVDETIGNRIRWTVTAEDFELHDDWSPYKHFTIIPYFPYFIYGQTVGLIENLLDSQDLLNKTTSQELHVINTTANSGYIVQQGGLANMTPDELESKGAQSGVVIEVNGKVADTIKKIEPNQIPQGLDMLSRKGENYIKAISGRGDAQMGMTRADVSADPIEANNQFSDVGLRWPMSNLKRSDFFLARAVLDLVQEYYTDPRIMMITHDDMVQEQEAININWPDPETGEIQNDLTMGEYDITIVSQNVKETLDQNNLEIALKLKELGIAIPDESLIENSNLIGKSKIIKALRDQAASPEAAEAKEVARLGGKLQLAEIKAKASDLEASTTKKKADAALSIAEAQKLAQGEPGEQQKAQQEMAIEQQKHVAEMQMQKEAHDQEMQLEREKAQLKAELDRQAAEDKRLLARAQAVMTMKQTAQNPQGKETV